MDTVSQLSLAEAAKQVLHRMGGRAAIAWLFIGMLFTAVALPKCAYGQHDYLLDYHGDVQEAYINPMMTGRTVSDLDAIGMQAGLALKFDLDGDGIQDESPSWGLPTSDDPSESNGSPYARTGGILGGAGKRWDRVRFWYQHVGQSAPRETRRIWSMVPGDSHADRVAGIRRKQ